MAANKNQVFSPVDKDLAKSLTIQEIAAILGNTHFVEDNPYLELTLSPTGRKITGRQYCSLFEHFQNELLRDKEIVKYAAPVSSQADYEKAYWAYVTCNTSDVNEPPKLLQEMINTITSLDINHVIDKQKGSNALPVFALALVLPFIIFSVLSAFGLL